MLNSGGGIHSRINTSIGALHGGGDTAVIVPMGPGLAWVSPSQQFVVEVGISPTLLSRHDFGGPFQFSSFAGLSFRPGQHIMASFRVQHMSNFSIYDHNPGLDQAMLGINYQF